MNTNTHLPWMILRPGATEPDYCNPYDNDPCGDIHTGGRCPIEHPHYWRMPTDEVLRWCRG